MSLTVRLSRRLASPIAVLIAVPLLVLVVGGFFVVEGEQRLDSALTGMTQARLDDQNRSTVRRVREILEQADAVLPAAERLGRRYAIDGDAAALAQDLADHMRHMPALSWIHIALDGTRFDGVARDPATGELLFHQARDGERIAYRLDGEALVVESRKPGADFYPRDRPWYRLAITSQEPVWTDPYLFSSSQTPGISRTVAVRDATDSVEMVVTAELDLATLSRFLEGQESLRRARSIIVTDDGILLADSGREGGVTGFDDLPTIEEIADPVLRACVQTARESPEDHAVRFSASDGETQESFLAGVRRLTVGDSDWMVARLVPETVVIEPAEPFITTGRLVAGSTLAVGLLLAVLLSRALVHARREISMARSRVDLAEQEVQRMGSYRLVKRLGEGGMGEVWLGRHHFLARPAAVKFMTFGGEFDDDEAQSRFQREARAISRLRCRNTIEIYDFGIDGQGRVFYAMELLDGVDLDVLVERYGPQPPTRVIQLLRQACSSLAEAHDQGLVHRDIKPGNIFTCRQVDELDVVKVLDFGLAIRAAESGEESDARLTRSGIINGTPEFMAPEQCRAHQLDGRADIYALGCVAWWLLSGKVVFDAPNAMDIVLKQIEEPPPRLSDVCPQAIPHDLERIVHACLNKDPGKRPPDARTLSRLLARVDVGPNCLPWGWDEAVEWWKHVPCAIPEDDDSTKAVVIRRQSSVEW